MRVVIVFLLLLANATVLLWQFYRPPDRRPLTPTIKGVPELQLVTSRSAAAMDRPGLTPPTAAATSTEDVDHARSAKREASKPVGPKSERSKSGGSQAQGSQAQTNNVCLAVGPFTQRDDAVPAQKMLHGWGQPARILPSETEHRRYWVYLPPLATARDARRELAALKARGIVDLQLLGSDQMENAISLGLYKDHDIAQRRLEQIRGMGYTPKMDTISQSVTAYWLVVERSGASFNQDHRRQVLALQPGLSVQSRPCP